MQAHCCGSGTSAQRAHWKTEYEQNPPIYDTTKTLTQNRATINERRPIEDFQAINRWMHGLNSSYNSLQIAIDKRYSQQTP